MDGLAPENRVTPSEPAKPYIGSADADETLD